MFSLKQFFILNGRLSLIYLSIQHFILISCQSFLLKIYNFYNKNNNNNILFLLTIDKICENNQNFSIFKIKFSKLLITSLLPSSISSFYYILFSYYSSSSIINFFYPIKSASSKGGMDKGSSIVKLYLFLIKNY